jgi:hypothetical protein
MFLRKLLILNAALAAFHGLGFILMPSFMLNFYQIAQGSGALVMGQLFGAELIVVAVITWLGREFTDAKALSAVIWANLLADAVGTVISVQATLTGGMGSTGWLAVAIYGGLAVAYVVVLFGRNAQSV